ncbi:MAG: hypothetical protein AAF633_15590, partial [Chloroflexota bacterium]
MRRKLLGVSGFILILVMMTTIASDRLWQRLFLSVFSPSNVFAQTTPADSVVIEPVQSWAYGGGFLYWSNHCFPSVERADAAVQSPSQTDPYRLRRMPLNGGTRRTLDQTTVDDCRNYLRPTADDEAIYYYNEDQAQIEKMPIDQPDQPPQILASNIPNVTSEFILEDGMLYYGSSGGGTSRIWRLSTDGGTPQVVTSTSSTPLDLAFSGSRLYWIGGDGVWSVLLPCSPCVPSQYSENGGRSLVVGASTVGSGGVYWVAFGDADTPERILNQIPVINGVRDVPVYTAPAGSLILDLEETFTFFAVGIDQLFWVELNAGQDLIRRLDIGSVSADIIHASDGVLSNKLEMIGRDLYFARTDIGNGALKKIPADADALTRTVEAVAWEITQGVQNLENTVPWIADKPTFVRLYAEQSDGNITVGVEAWLEGSRDGVPLPGSPLSPLNGVQRLETGSSFSRDPNPGSENAYLFKLPGSWDNAGEIELRAVVDPRQSFGPQPEGATELSATLLFENEPEPCLFVWPIETEVGHPEFGDPIFWDAMDRFVTLFPTSGANVVWMSEPIRELEACLDWDLHCWGPYEMDQGWELTNFPPDSDRVLAKLMLRQATSRVRSPLYCESPGPVHTLGAVHGDSNTGGTGGFANFLINASWVKFDNAETDPGRAWNTPTSGATLAQEITHNYWRYHIGCRANEDSFFGLADWPYNDRCVLDDRPLTEPTTHYGFDPISQLPIPPDDAGDFMTYRGVRWVSDVTFKDVKEVFSSPSETFINSARFASTSGQVEPRLLVSGIYESVEQIGSFYYTYQLPSDMLTDVALGSPPTDENGNIIQHDHRTHIHLPAADSAEFQEPTARLRLLNPQDQLISVYSVELMAPDNHGEALNIYTFLTQIPFPEIEIGKMELLIDGQVVSQVIPSQNAPVVELLSPTQGETIEDEWTIQWRATDVDNDELLFSVNYSPDNGTTWLPIVTQYPGDLPGDVTTLTLENPETLPGTSGNSGYLRLITSDGFHTTVSEVGPFSVANRAPQLIIQQPAAGDRFDPLEPILLRGLGYDAESGLMDDDQLTWLVDGTPIGEGRQLNVSGLASGAHTISLVVSDQSNQTATAEIEIDVLPLSIEARQTNPSMDGRCHDGAYQAVEPLVLESYAEGGQASIYLYRRQADLYLCATGLAFGPEENISSLSLRLDPDGSGDTFAQINDFLISIGEDGTPSQMVGDGVEGFVSTAQPVLEAVQIAADGETWSAEMRLSGEEMGLWNSQFRLALDHTLNNQVLRWPLGMEKVKPSTWSLASNEVVPQITTVSPLELVRGDPSAPLTIQGDRFTEETQLYWDTEIVVTEYIS